MEAHERTIVVTGATGLQGGAVARHLYRNGWHVRALTRTPNGARAAALAALGVDVVQADTSDPEPLRAAFSGAYGVFSVQNPVISGIGAEVQQGMNVADAAKEAGVQHLVYSSAGLGTEPTGVPSWDSKLRIERHVQESGVPSTILRPMAFMELMTEKKFYPAISTWHVMPTLMGEGRPVHWLSVEDLGAIVEKVFGDPGSYVGKALNLVSDSQSIDECRMIYLGVFGRNPPRLPIPVWMFERMGFVGADLSTMWRWLRTARFEVDLESTHRIHPSALGVRAWLSSRAASSARR